MIVLDTNVVSELMRPLPAPGVVRWVTGRREDELWLTTMTAAELLHGAAAAPDGRRRDRLTRLVGRLLDEVFAGRLLAFDAIGAAEYADIVDRRSRAGRPIGTADAVIAATTRAAGAELATRNTRDFAGTGLVRHDPWAAGAG